MAINYITHEDQLTSSLIGYFVTLWSVFETVLEVGIMRELEISAAKSSILTCDMGTKARAEILRSLIYLRDPENRARSLISKIQSEGERNTIHHGTIQVRPLPHRFIKRTANGKYQERIIEFSPDRLRAHITKLIELIDELQKELDISDEDLNRFILCHKEK